MKEELKKICEDYTSSPESGKGLYDELLVLFSVRLTDTVQDAKEWWSKECFKKEYKNLDVGTKEIVDSGFKMMQFYYDELSS